MKKLVAILAAVVTILFLVILFQYFNLWPHVQTLITDFTASFTTEKTAESTETASEKTPNNPEEPSKLKRNRGYSELIHKGNTLLENSYANLAIQEYTEAAQQEPTEAEPYFKIGAIHFENEAYEKALINFKEAQKRSPDSLETKINVARTYLGLEEYTQSKDLFDAITEENQTVKFYQGMLAAFYNDHARAQELFGQAVEIGTTEQTTQKAQAFSTAYQEYEATEGTQAVYLKVLLGNAYVQASEFSLAKEVLFEAIKDKNDYRDAWILLGYVYLEEQAYQDALESLETALEFDSTKPETRFFLGLAYFGLDEYDKSIRELEMAKDNGFEPVIQVQQKLAELYVLTENYVKAIENYEAVINQNQDDLEYFIRPIWIYIDKLQEAEKALLLAQKAYDAHPESAMSFNFLGWSYIALNDESAALSNLEKALEIDSNLGAAYLNFGQLYEKQGKLDQAKENYQKAYQLEPNSSVGNLAAEKYNQLIAIPAET